MHVAAPSDMHLKPLMVDYIILDVAYSHVLHTSPEADENEVMLSIYK